MTKSNPKQPSAKPKTNIAHPPLKPNPIYSGLVGVALLLIIVAIGVGFIVDRIYIPVSPSEKPPSDFYVYANSNFITIAERLRSNGLIKSKTAFLVYAKLTGQDRTLHAGLFQLSPAYSMKRIIRILQEKEGPARLTKITIREGLSVTEIADLFAEKQLANKPEFVAYARYRAKKTFESKYPFLKEVPTDNIEGYLFPETYFFAQGNSMETIFNQLLNQFSNKIYTPWKKTPTNTQLTFHQLVTLASIIEKESNSTSEMRLISSVFYNRLNKHIKLESCPTVLFAIGEPQKDTVFYRDLEVKSPYNTYRHAGLPPTPIASIGVTAFQSAIDPEPSDYYFFVAKGDGSHYFSKTLSEHLKNKMKYMRYLKNTKTLKNKK